MISAFKSPTKVCVINVSAVLTFKLLIRILKIVFRTDNTTSQQSPKI